MSGLGMGMESDKSEVDELLNSPSIPVVTRALDAPLVFADALYHISSINGVARLAFVQNHTEPTGTPEGDKGFQGKHVVVVAIPIEQLRAAAGYLNQTIKNFEAAGLLAPAS